MNRVLLECLQFFRVASNELSKIPRPPVGRKNLRQLGSPCLEISCEDSPDVSRVRFLVALAMMDLDTRLKCRAS
jgi:hypothetical protein